jgi:hypothetical protein
MLGADFFHAVLHNLKGELRPIAFAAEVAKVDLLQFCGHDLLSNFSRGLIGEMAVAA